MWKPCHDLRRGLARGPLARGHAACYARQAGFLQDAKPEATRSSKNRCDLLDQTAPPTLTSSFTRDRVSTAVATTARATRLSRRARRHGLPTPSSKGSPCRAAAAGRSGALLSLTTLPAIRFPSVTSRRRRVPLSSPRLAAASTTCPRSSSTLTSKMRKRREHFWSSVW